MSAGASPQGMRVRRGWASPWWAFVLVIVAYACVALWQITLPGVYMDAVNPDYLVAKILNRQAQPIGAWKPFEASGARRWFFRTGAPAAKAGDAR